MASDPVATEAEERGPFAEQVDERTERADWRSSIFGAIGVSLLIGLWLIASAALLSYAEPANVIIWGALIAFLSMLRLLANPRSRTLAYTSAAAGALTVVSAFAFSDPPGETANVALWGLATVVLAFVGLSARAEVDRSSRP